MALIDLGEVRDDPRPEPAAWRRPQVGRRWRVGLVVVLVLVTLAGAAPARQRVTSTVPGGAGAEAFVADDLLVVVGPPLAGVGGERELTAYELPDDGRTAPPTLRPRWRTTVARIPNIWPNLVAAGVLLAVGSDETRETTTTVALDAATGRERWRQPGEATITEGGRVLLTTRDGEGGRAVRAVDPTTGAAHWWIPGSAERIDFRVTPRGVDRLVRSLPSGRIEVRDAESGRLLAETVHPGAPEAGVGGRVVDDLLLTFRGDPVTLTAYGLDRLDRRWSVELPLTGYVSSCGTLLCVWLGSGVLALDRTTGRSVWRDSQLDEAVPVGDRLVAITSFRQIQRESVLLEAASGRFVAGLGTWNGLYAPVEGEAPLAFREIRNRGLLVAAIDVEAGWPRVLDVLPGDHTRCRFHPGLLVCQQPTDHFRIWWLTP